jgi:hypothetical protein
MTTGRKPSTMTMMPTGTTSCDGGLGLAASQLHTKPAYRPAPRLEELLPWNCRGRAAKLEHFRGDWNRKGLPKRVASVILGLR